MAKTLDIDDQSENSAFQQNEEAFKELASRFSHEISQPLTVIAIYVSGCIRRLEEDICDKEQIIAALKTVNHQIDRARDVIHRMNNLADQQES